MLVRRIVKKAVSVWTTFPICSSKAAALFQIGLAQLCRGKVRRFTLMAIGLAVATLLILLDWPFGAMVVALVSLSFVWSYLHGWIERRSKVAELTERVYSTAGLTPAEQTLVAFGFDQRHALELVAQAGPNGEVRLASFDQDNRILSYVGPLPAIARFEVTPDEFRTRHRHQLDLVITRGVCAIRKAFGNRVCFERELLALDSLADIEGVPKIVAATAKPPVLYQSYLFGDNLGSLLVAQGVSVSDQYQLDNICHRQGARDHVDEFPRTAALAALKTVIPKETVERLLSLIERIHRVGVVFRDIKYGNVIVANGVPSLCDFESANVFGRNNWRSYVLREADLDMFNFYFDGSATTARTLKEAVKRFSEVREDSFTK
jgi:hypothetical protein